MEVVDGIAQNGRCSQGDRPADDDAQDADQELAAITKGVSQQAAIG